MSTVWSSILINDENNFRSLSLYSVLWIFILSYIHNSSRFNVCSREQICSRFMFLCFPSSFLRDVFMSLNFTVTIWHTLMSHNITTTWGHCGPPPVKEQIKNPIIHLSQRLWSDSSDSETRCWTETVWTCFLTLCLWLQWETESWPETTMKSSWRVEPSGYSSGLQQ